MKCQAGATIAEYAIGAAMVATALGAAEVSAPEPPAPIVRESCTYRGATPRWERPKPRCTLTRPADRTA